ncbi:MAG: cupredoxin domain-containing protein [Chloroflexota bacterium]
MKIVALVGALLLTGLVSGCAPRAAASPQATVVFRYSRFEPANMTVPVGVPVLITLRNDDPIEHEWIVGPPSVHQAHRTGTEAVHNERPTEVTVPPYATKTTTVVFDQAGSLQFICHLPGHEAYGMTGLLTVAR